MKHQHFEINGSNGDQLFPAFKALLSKKQHKKKVVEKKKIIFILSHLLMQETTGRPIPTAVGQVEVRAESLAPLWRRRRPAGIVGVVAGLWGWSTRVLVGVRRRLPCRAVRSLAGMSGVLMLAGVDCNHEKRRQENAR